MRVFSCTVAALLFGVFARAEAAPILIGPHPGPGVPYLKFADSPFAAVDFSGGYFHFEDFEDHLLNVPGVTGSGGGVTSVVFGPSIHDSVDADDGTIDGSGLAGDSWFRSPGVTGVTWTFDEVTLGALPTHVGIVWTDGAGTIGFEAFDKNGVSLGALAGAHADGVHNGTTIDDRFYGVIDSAGIGSIRITNSSGGIEVDHLQFGNPGSAQNPIPEPGTIVLIALGGVALLLRRRVR